MYKNTVTHLKSSFKHCYNILNKKLSKSVASSVKSKSQNETFEPFLEEHICVKEPVCLFKLWFEEVCNAKKVALPKAMALATATKDGAPSLRMMMLRSYGKEGFAFCTHYDSRKGIQIEENPQAALTFFWAAHEKSVRIEGSIMKLNVLYSQDCFKKIEKENQIVAFCSKQSKAIPGRQTLEMKQKEFANKYKDCEIPIPHLWGGYIVVPHMIEFWQGQQSTDRLHDRIRFRRPKPNDKIDGVLLHKGEDGWVYERLAP